MIPSLKGFYEDKTEKKGRKELNNVITGNVEPGFKRASLGEFCYIENGDCIRYSSVDVGEDVNINMGRGDNRRTVFRSQYICKDQLFSGYIIFDDEISDELRNKIREIFNGTVFLGNKRSAGYGECKCIGTCEETEGIPYSEYCSESSGKDMYMVLLSDTVMRDDNGELSGLNLQELAESLGCENISIEKCSTSISEIRGYNRMWHGAIPSAVMYEAGSVFHLKASSDIDSGKMKKLEETGIGIRRDEGFGRVIFMNDYPKIRYKESLHKAEKSGDNDMKYGKKCDTDSDIKIAATGLLRQRIENAIDRYVVDNKTGFSGISSSKIGLLRSMCMELMYQPQEALRQLKKFADHQSEKDSRNKVHNNKAKQDVLVKYINNIIDGDLFEILDMKGNSILGVNRDDILSDDELIQYKLKIIIRKISFMNRGGRE